MRGEWVGWIGRVGRVGWMRRIDRKVTLVALRSFFVGGWGLDFGV